MLDNINHQKSVNKIYTEIFSHLLDGYHQENEMSGCQACWEKEVLVHCQQDCKLVQSLQKTLMEVPQKN